MEETIEKLQKELRLLKAQFLLIEKLEEKSQGGYEEKYLVLKYENLKVKIDACKNHKRPHLHVDYGSTFHAISIAIDTCEVLAGSLPSKYLNKIQPWVIKNQEPLQKIWDALMNSANPDSLLLELQSE